jgi:hypothetical protein
LCILVALFPLRPVLDLTSDFVRHFLLEMGWEMMGGGKDGFAYRIKIELFEYLKNFIPFIVKFIELL